MNDIDDDAADELTLRYRRASAGDPSRPSQQTREAISSQARKMMTLRSPRAADEAGLAQMEASTAANDSRWNLRAVAAMAVVGLVGLIATQTLRQSPKPDSPAAEVVASATPQLTQQSVPSAPSVSSVASERASRPPAAAGGAAMEASNARSVARADTSPVISDAPPPAAPAAAPPVAERYRFERDANAVAKSQGLVRPAILSDEDAVAGGSSNNRLENVSVNAATDTAQQSLAVSQVIEKSLKAAQDAMNAKKYEEALGLLRQAESNPGKKPYDQFVINEFLGPIYARQNKYAEAYEAFSANADSQYLTQGKSDRYKVLAQLAYQLKNYPAAVEWGNKAIAAGENGNDVWLIVAQSYFLLNKYQEAAVATQELVSRAEKAGQRPQETNLKLLWECYRKLNDANAEGKIIEKLLTYYPKPDYWANAMPSLQQMPNRSDRLTLQTYRLMQDVGTLKRADQYAEMAQLAQEQGFPGEAQAVLEQGMAKNVFTEQRDKERAGRQVEVTRRLAETARQQLPVEEQVAASSVGGEQLVAVGSSYLHNASDPGKAVALINLGISRGGVSDLNDAYVSLGLAQLRNRNPVEAKRSFQSVAGDDAYGHLARLWQLRQR